MPDSLRSWIDFQQSLDSHRPLVFHLEQAQFHSQWHRPRHSRWLLPLLQLLIDAAARLADHLYGQELAQREWE